MSEIAIVVFFLVITSAVGSLIYFKRKQAANEVAKQVKREADAARITELTRRISRQSIAEKEREVLRSHANYGHNRFNPRKPDVLLPERRTVVNSGSDDILTQMIIVNALTSHHDVTAGTVSWKDDTPAITPTEIAQSYIEPERTTTSYSSPEPERSSYSSSSSDSSYSSSSSDSSYSSSSSDSSYSSD